MAEVKGIWRFNPVIVPDETINNREIDLSFKLLGINLTDYDYPKDAFNGFILSVTEDGETGYLQYINNEKFLDACDIGVNKWLNFYDTPLRYGVSMQTIYLGDTEQFMPEDVYTWFVNNANPITKEIAGNWELRDNLYPIRSSFTTNVNFTLTIEGIETQCYGLNFVYNEDTLICTIYGKIDENDWNDTNSFLICTYTFLDDIGWAEWTQNWNRKIINITSKLYQTHNGDILLDFLSQNAVYWGNIEPEEPDKPIEPDEPDKPIEPDEPDKPIEPDEPDEPILNKPLNVISGIGDRLNSINLIMPEFDATIYNFIVGTNGIIDGFEISENEENIVLSAGTLLVKGYRGITTGASYFKKGYNVYARFVFNNDINVTDEFLIFDTPNISEYETNIDDVTPEIAGTYDILLVNLFGEIETGIQRLKYPINALNSDYADEVTTALLEGVTGVTAPVNSNNKLVATAEYVHNQIEEEINYRTPNGDIIVDNQIIGTYNIKIKAKYLILNVTYNDWVVVGTPLKGSKQMGTLPKEFAPEEMVTCGVGQSDINEYVYSHRITYATINTNGVITMYWETYDGLANQYAIYPTILAVGYRIKE